MAIREVMQFFKENESKLVDQILHYAKQYGYSQYTSARSADWVASIHEITQSLEAATEETTIEIDIKSPKMNALTQFGIDEAVKHRSRGVTLEMFLSLMKYYRDAYITVYYENHPEDAQLYSIQSWLTKAFDQIEVAFISEWNSHSDSEQIKSMQLKALNLTNEKNRYLTLFESIPISMMLLDEHFMLENMNLKAKELLIDMVSYKADEQENHKSAMSNFQRLKALDFQKTFQYNLKAFVEDETLGNDHFISKIELNNHLYEYSVEIMKMRDISGRFNGIVVMFTLMREVMTT